MLFDEKCYLNTLPQRYTTIWLYGILLSFFWELPLCYISSFNRLNPRCYDVFFVLGLFLFNSKIISTSTKNKIYQSWKGIVIWFFLCALFYSMIASTKNMLYSLLCAARYIQGLIVVKMILLLPPEKVEKALGRCCFIGLIIISVYCFFELAQSHSGRLIEIAPGKFIKTYYKVIYGPLSFSYFHIAQIIPLALTCVISQMLHKSTYRWIILLVCLLCWPVLWCGSRMGAGLTCLSILNIFIIISLGKVRNIKVQISFVLLAALLFIGILIFFPNLFDDATTINRFERLEDLNHDSIFGRLGIWGRLEQLIKGYDYWYLLPFVGAGFNFAPINGINRICYGIHCSLIYPLEQSGILGEILFFAFCVKSCNTIWPNRNGNSIALGAFSFFVASLILGVMGAHNFWREFETGNVNTLIIIVFCIASVSRRSYFVATSDTTKMQSPLMNAST